VSLATSQIGVRVVGPATGRSGAFAPLPRLETCERASRRLETRGEAGASIHS
jgi:hypothetical protein